MRRNRVIGCSVLAILLTSLGAIALGAFGTPAVRALDLFPVRTLWTLRLGRQLGLPPAYSGRHAYFALDGNQLVAYDLASGMREWQVAGAPETALAAGGGLVFLVERAGLSALHAADGRAAWRFALGARLTTPPTWDNGWLVLTAEDGDIIALRGLDGQPIWRRAAKARARVAPSLAADRLYVALEDGRILALRIDTGDIIWESRVGGSPTSLLALDDRLFVGSTDNFFYCLLAKSGTWDWRWRTGGDIVGAPVVDDRRVYFVSFDNVLRALSRKTGGQQWVRLLPLRPAGGAIRAGSALIVAAVAPALRAYRMSDGGPAGDLATDGELAAPVYPVPDTTLPTLLVVTRDLATGATAKLVARQLEPSPTTLAPLANPVKLPALPDAAPSK
ncbi:MAG: PQQ-binding-like beta-propeller repeat protein [Acidobacteriota bacterium]